MNTPLKAEVIKAKIIMRFQCRRFTSEGWTQSGHWQFLFGLLTQLAVLVFVRDMKKALFVGIHMLVKHYHSLQSKI